MAKLRIINVFETMNYEVRPPEPSLAVTYRTAEGYIDTALIPKKELEKKKIEEVIGKYIKKPHPLVGKEITIK